MSGALPWTPAPPNAPPVDATDALRRIEQNTGQLVYWVKVLAVATIILVLINVLIVI